MKRNCLFCLIFALAVTVLQAQVSVSPSDDFYRSVESWQLRNLVDAVPPMRPYPLKNCLAILESVIENGGERDVMLAKEYWEAFTGKSWEAYAEALVKAKVGDEAKARPSGFFGVAGDSFLYKDLVSIGYDIGVAGTVGSWGEYLPFYTNVEHDGIHDPASVGPIDLFINLNDAVAFGTKNVFAQAGIFRSGYGPFLNEGLAVNDTAFHRAQFSFSAIKERWSYTQLYAVIGATPNRGVDSAFDDVDLSANKYFSFHALDLHITPKLSLAYYEAAVFGRRTDPSYILPAPFYIAEILGGWGDSLLMGLSVNYKIVPGLLLAGDLLVDDFALNELFKLNLDAKNRLAARLGAIYTPENTACERLSLDYTLVTPYMYSHWDYDNADGPATMNTWTVNYQNYTNNGMAMGTPVPPNSDRISLALDFRPIKRLHLKTQATFIRHANVCESLSDEEAMRYLSAKSGVYSTDGSVFTHSMYSSETTAGEHVDTAWEHLNFLTQEHKMYIVQAGLSAEYELCKRTWGRLGFTFSYLFEYIHNKGVDSDLFPGKGLASATVADVEAAKKEWVSNLTDEVNHYFSLGVRFEF